MVDTHEQSRRAAVFAYEAQTAAGDRIDGRIEAIDGDAARFKLQALGLRVIELRPAGAPPPTRRLSADDFASFNQQLAALTQAGLPVEQGLRLIARDMDSGRLAASVRAVSDELDKGRSLKEAFDANAHRFPPLYGELVEAGVQSGDLPGVLLNLGRHMQMIFRLKRALWLAAAYPLAVLGAMVVLLGLLSYTLLPIYREIFSDFDTDLPWITELVLGVGRWMPLIAVGFIALVVFVPQVWWAAGMLGYRARVTEWAVRFLPGVGPLLRRSYAARWCDALRIGVDAGLDLPTAMHLAGRVIALPSIWSDTDALVNCADAGRPLRDAEPLATLPPLVPASIDLAVERGDLPRTLDQLTRLYEDQAELRLNVVATIFGPMLIVGIAGLLGFVIFALIAPFMSGIKGVSS